MDNLNRLRDLLVDDKGISKSWESSCGMQFMDSKYTEEFIGELYLLKSAGDNSINISENDNSERVIRRLKDGLKKCQAVLDSAWEKLNAGIWKDAPIYLRHMYSYASLVKAYILWSISGHYREPRGSFKDPLKLIRASLRSVDLGILLGMPTSDLTNAAQIILRELNHLTSGKELSFVYSDHPAKKIRMEMNDDFRYVCPVEVNHEDTTSTLCDSEECSPWRVSGRLRAVPVLFKPSLECFSAEHYSREIPVLIQGCLDHWPALSLWSPSYLAKVAGDRTVPVELGPNYVHPAWGQKLMAVGEFVKEHLEPGGHDTIGYLAQHPLFDQIPELRKDIKVPEYCCLSDESDSSDVEPDINAWFGPKGTVSPLHNDPKHNLLAQVLGSKRVILYSSDDSKYLHPFEGQLLSNTSQVDPEDPDILKKFPDISSAQVWECEIRAGDMLYIPRRWWHHVRALSTSFSVSFWW